MANRYANLVGTNKIKDEYVKINTGFDKVQADIDNLDDRVDTIITTPVEGVSAQEIIDARQGKSTLGENIGDIKNDLAAHKAENVYYTVAVARDISLTGIQSISLPFKTKSIICFAYIDATRVQSNGMWAENALQRAIAVQGDSGNRIGAVAVAFLRLTNANHAQCVVQNVTETGFELNWTKTGSPTGNASLFILASTHGGVA